MNQAVKTWVRVAAVTSAGDRPPQDGRNFAQNVQNPPVPTNTATPIRGDMQPWQRGNPARLDDHLMSVETRQDSKGLHRHLSGDARGESAQSHIPETRRRPQSSEPPKGIRPLEPRREEPRSGHSQGPSANARPRPAGAGRRLAQAAPQAAPAAAPPQGRPTDTKQPVPQGVGGRSTAGTSKLDSKLQAALKNNGKKGPPILEQINEWTNDEINRAFNGPDAFYAIYNHVPSRNPGSDPNNIGKKLDFERLSDTRHLTRGVQNYLKWASGLTSQNMLSGKEQAENLANVKETVSSYVKRALDRDQVSTMLLSGNVNGVLLDPAIWKYATSQSLVTLQGTRPGTRGVGRTLVAKQPVKQPLSELREYYRQPGTTLKFIRRFSIKELSYQDPNLLNGWYSPQNRPANGAEMRLIMITLDPAELINGDRARADTRFVQDAVKLQLKERSPSELTGVAAVLWKYASSATSTDTRKGGPRDHAIKWFFENFVTHGTQANLGRAMSLYAQQNSVDWTKLPAARTNAKTNNGLSIATALGADNCARGLVKNPRANDGLPELCPESLEILKYFELGDLVRCKNKFDEPVAGQYTFSRSPEGRCFTEEELPDLLQGFNEQRLIERLRPEEQSLNAPLRYGGNAQMFSLGIMAPSSAFRYQSANWFVELFTKSIIQIGVVGWDYTRFSVIPAFAGIRWTPGAADRGFLQPARRQVVDISVEADEYRRAKKALGVRAEVHFDAAFDIARKRPQLFVRGEGNAKASALGVFWQISRVWMGRQERRRGPGRGGGDAGGEGEGRAGGSRAGEGRAGGGGAGEGREGAGGGGGEDHPGWWAKLKSYADIAAAVRRMIERREQKAIEEGTEHMRTVQSRMLRQIEALAAKTGDYAEAERLGLTAEVGVNVPAEYSNLARDCSNVTIGATVTGGEGDKSWCITVPLIVTLPQRGLLSVDPRVGHLMKKIGVPEKAFETLSSSMSKEEQDRISKLKPGVRFWVQIYKALEGAVFFNFNFTPGVSYAGLYLDVGFVLPIVVLSKPLGRGGVTTPARRTANLVFPLWVRGLSIQIYGNRNEKVSTAGIVIR